jgi:hypothetical protein
MRRDIDLIIAQLTADVPGIHIEQLKVTHPGNDDDGLWFIQIMGRQGEVQIESPSGNCPFLIESDFNNDRFDGHSLEEVIATVKSLFALA